MNKQQEAVQQIVINLTDILPNLHNMGMADVCEKVETARRIARSLTPNQPTPQDIIEGFRRDAESQLEWLSTVINGLRAHGGVILEHELAQVALSAESFVRSYGVFVNKQQACLPNREDV